MSKFRIKEVKNAREGNKSLFYPQVKRLISFRTIKPSEMKGDKYRGDVIAFRSEDNARYFIQDYKAEKNIKTKKSKQSNIVYHEVV